MAEEQKNTVSAFDMERLEVYKTLCKYLLPIEANVVSIFFKNPDLMFDYEDVNLNLFQSNVWKVYFVILHEVYVTEKKKKLDEYTIAFYLDKHPKLKEKYIEYGGYGTLTGSSQYIDENNIDGYVTDLYKYNTLVNLNNKSVFPIKPYLKQFVDKPLDQIYDFYEAVLNDAFVRYGNGTEEKSYDITDNLDELYNELKQGSMLGLPYYNMNLLTSETNGCALGTITLVGGVVNVGKSSFVRNAHLTSLLKYKEPVVVFINEEDLKKWQTELLIYISNNLLKKNLTKYMIKHGELWSKETDDTVKEAIAVLEKLKKKQLIIHPFQTYTTKKVIKMIKKFSALGIKYFVLDTFKQSSDTPSNAQTWNVMKQEMVQIYDTVKPICKNVHLLATFQLSKASTRMRYFTVDNIGESKSIADPATVVIMFRDVFDDEKMGGKRELTVYSVDENGLETEIQLDPQKHYQLGFVVKTRDGKHRQIVFEHDLARNVIKEVGYTIVPFEN